MSKKVIFSINPETDKLEKSHVLENYGGIGIDWVEFNDGTKAPMLSLRAPEQSDRDDARIRREKQ